MTSTAPDRDYYEVLGIPRDADQKAIKKAYHRQAMKWHPDRNKSAQAEEKFKEIAKAYAILSDEKKRALYDSQGYEGVAHFTTDDLYRDIDFGSIFGDLGISTGSGSVFERFFTQRPLGPERGRDLRIVLDIPLQRIDSGGKETLRFGMPIICPSCHGYGTRSGKPPPHCSACQGSGRKVITHHTSRGRGVRFQQVTDCSECQGRGVKPAARCTSCDGSGQVDTEKTIKISIPAGIEDGMVLRIPGYGLPGENGMAPGDLQVVIHSLPDERFQRRGADLWHNETIGVIDAILGTALHVQTLQGDVVVKVPPGTQPDRILRLRGKGLPRFHGSGRGDLNLCIRVHVPEKLTAEERRLYTKLRDQQHR